MSVEQKEPAMDEILSSIRNILSKDEKVGDKGESAEPVDGEVVNLTEDMLIQNKSTNDKKSEDVAETLVAEPAIKASAESLAHLAKTIEQERQAPAPQTSLEGVVMDLLKPYLREWLNAHLPEIVERVVQKEVRRVVEHAEF